MRDNVFEECLRIKNEFANSNIPFWQGLADKWGYGSKEAIRKAFIRELAKRGIKTNSNIGAKFEPEESIDFKRGDDYININCSTRRLKTEKDVIKEFGIDTETWKLDYFRIKYDEAWRRDRKVNWQVEEGRIIHGDVDDSGKILLVPLTRIECRFIPRELEDVTEQDIVEFYKNHEFPVVSISLPKRKKLKVPKVLEICVADCHIGARWYNKNWSDLETLLPNMIDDIISQVENMEFSQIWLSVLGDVFHYENRAQQTERHMQVVESNGMNPLEMFDQALGLFIPVIDKLLEIAPVKTRYIPGNHDGDSLYHLLCCLGAYYRNTKDFVADLSHTSRKWELFGPNLVAWEHGEMPNKNKLHWLMTEAAEDWGKAKYREIHWAHLHSEEVVEYGGLKRRRVPAIVPTDFWHHRNGYNGATRATMAFVWEEDRIGFAQMWQSTGVRDE